MKRTAAAWIVMAALGGCVSTGEPSATGPSFGGGFGQVQGPPSIPGVQGPWGQPVAMAAPYSSSPPGAEAAMAMMAYNVPMDLIQQAGGMALPGAGSGIIQAGGQSVIGPPGLPHQPVAPGMGMGLPPGAVAGVGALTTPLGAHSRGAGAGLQAQRTEIAFVGPQGMHVSWYTPGGFAGSLAAPARYNFLQGAIYRLKLSSIPNRPGVELYPTLEVVPANAKTDPFLAHSAVPITFTNEDLDQVAAGNFLIKVVYLPDPAFQDIAATAPDEIVSTRLEPGVDPIAEAARRGSVLVVIRLGNINLELANSPAMNSPSMYGGQALMPIMPGQGLMPGYSGPAGPSDLSGLGGRPYGPVVQPGQMIPLPSTTPPGVRTGPTSQIRNVPATQPVAYQTGGSQNGDPGSGDSPYAGKKQAKTGWWWQNSSDKN